jgi:hypothetical protein
MPCWPCHAVPLVAGVIPVYRVLRALVPKGFTPRACLLDGGPYKGYCTGVVVLVRWRALSHASWLTQGRHDDLHLPGWSGDVGGGEKVWVNGRWNGPFDGERLAAQPKRVFCRDNPGTRVQCQTSSFPHLTSSCPFSSPLIPPLPASPYYLVA